MRTTITLDDDVFEIAQSQAKASGKRLGEVVSALVRRGLKAAPSQPSKKALPTFNVPPDAPIITSERVKSFLDEEP